MRPLRWCVLVALLATACSDNRVASDRAAEGAASGAVAGAVGGAVWALVWGGDVAGRAAAGAATGAAVGATMGGISGAMTDEEIRRELGPDNYRAIFAVVDCEHADARAHVAKAEQADDAQYRLAADWLMAVIEWDEGRRNGMEPYYDRIVEADEDVDTRVEVKSGVQSVIRQVEDERARLGRRRRCA